MALKKVYIFSGVPKIHINEMRMKPNKHIHREYHFMKAIRSNGYQMQVSMNSTRIKARN
jgi:hypothetical protein